MVVYYNLIENIDSDHNSFILFILSGLKKPPHYIFYSYSILDIYKPIWFCVKSSF